MKFFRRSAPVLVALVLLLGVSPAFASEAPDPPDAYAPEAGEVLTDVPADDTPAEDDLPAPADDAPADGDLPAPDGDDPVWGDTPSDADGDSDPTVNPGNPYVSVTDIGGGYSEGFPGEVPADLGTLPGFLRAVFGEYTPKTQTVYTYFDGQLLDVATEYVPGIAGMDMEWIASVFLFGMVVYCLFRMLGGMVR